MMGMPALRMRDGNPAEHLGEFAVMTRPEQQMPVIGHQAISGDANLRLGLGFSENLLKRGVVSGLLKERQPTHAPVQHVISTVSSSEARAAWHAEVSTEIGMDLSRRDSRPLLLRPDYSSPGLDRLKQLYSHGISVFDSSEMRAFTNAFPPGNGR